MIDIKPHPYWNQTNMFGSRLSFIKKPLYFLRIYLAREYARIYPKDLFIGVAGSIGKSVCVQLCKAVLSQKFTTITTKLNLDPIFNIPQTIFKLRPSVKKAVFEMGVEYPGEMDFYLSLIHPKTVILTKTFYVHNESLGNIEQIAKEQGKLLEELSGDCTAILNYDDLIIRKLAQNCKAQIIFFGMDQKNCDIWAGNIKIEDFKTTFELNIGVERVKVNFRLLGLHQIYASLAAAALGLVNNIPLTKIKIALESIEPSEHRMQAVWGPNGSVIIDDTFDSSPAGVDVSIDILGQIPARRRVLVLGEMRGLGKYSDLLHKEIARKIFKDKIDLVVLGLGEAQIIADELKSLGFLEERLFAHFSNSQMVSKLLKTLGKGDICLIKGSRPARLDEVVGRISKKI